MNALLKRITPWVVGGLVVAGVVIGSLIAANELGEEPVDEAVAAEPNTTTVGRNDLVEEIVWDGLLDYTSVGELTHRADELGVLTSIAPVGSLVENSGELYRVDDEPIVLVIGDGNLWRELNVGSVGDDVLAIETALVAMGFDPDGTVTVDDTYTYLTAEMVLRFQTETGRSETGIVEVGSIVMRPEPVRVGEHLLMQGADVDDGAAVTTISGVTRAVTFDVEPASRGDIAVGDIVNVRLPDRSTVSAVVEFISPGVDEDTGAYIASLTITEDGGFTSDLLPIEVIGEVEHAVGALTVPPDALIAAERGRYLVRVLGENNSDRLIEVRIVGEANRLVAIEGEGLTEGTIVVTP